MADEIEKKSKLKTTLIKKKPSHTIANRERAPSGDKSHTHATFTDSKSKPKIKLKKISNLHSDGEVSSDQRSKDSIEKSNKDAPSKPSSHTSQKEAFSRDSRPPSKPAYTKGPSQYTRGQSKQDTDASKTHKSFQRKRNPLFGESSSHTDNKEDTVTSSRTFSQGDKDTAKRSFKATRKKQFVNKRKQFVEKELFVNKKKTEAVVMSNPIPKSVSILESISIADLAKKMNLKSSELLTKLMSMGMMANQNSVIDHETAQLLASEYDCEIQVISLYDQTLIETPEEDIKNAKERPPIVTIMGHVDHGKTTLLDTIRKSKIVDLEQGNITQHIGAYMVQLDKRAITFLDTPGHEAFSLMRYRGSRVTDIIVLVIAADDGVKPQTEEAIVHAKKAEVPIIVALNKMDSPSANPEKIYQQLTEFELVPEEWGGDLVVCKISALKREGIDDLLEHILLQAELLELKADQSVPAQGVVLESKIEQGRGIVATLLINKGTLKKGSSFVVGVFNGKVREIYNDRGENIDIALPGMPVEIIGLDGVPSAGDPFQITESEKIARQIANKRQELNRHKAGESVKKVTSDTLYESIETDNTTTYNVIIKGDVHGSVEAIKESLEKLGNDEIKVRVIHASAGDINAADVILASTSNANIIGFHVRPNQQVQKLANQEKVKIEKFTIIFDVIESVKTQIESMLAPEYMEEKIGEAEVRELFAVPKIGTIAGSYMYDGKVEKNSIVKVLRKGKEIYNGSIASLKRHKDDVNSVEKGFECGIALDNFKDFEVGDSLMIYKKVAVARKL